jgi:hypothetical protein
MITLGNVNIWSFIAAIPEQNKNGLKIATYGEIRNIFS